MDDSPTETLIFRNALRKAGFRVETAINREEGVRTAQRVHPDLILMDLIMPVLNGFQAMCTLQRDPATPRISVITVTTKDQKPDQAWGLRQGAVDYLVKPVLQRCRHPGRHGPRHDPRSVPRRSEFVKESKTQARGNRIPLFPKTIVWNSVVDLGFFHNLSAASGHGRGHQRRLRAGEGPTDPRVLGHRQQALQRHDGHSAGLTDMAPTVLPVLETSAEVAKNAATLAEVAGAASQETENVSSYIAELTQRIVESARRQSREAEGIDATLSLVQEITRRNTMGTRQMAESVEALVWLTVGLQGSVAGFHLP